MNRSLKVFLACLLTGALIVGWAKGDLAIINDSRRPSVMVPPATLKPLLTAAADDPAWERAASLPPLTPSVAATEIPTVLPATKVLLTWDPDYLYVRFICSSQEIYTPFHGRNAPLYRGDAVEIFLDPKGDAREWIEMQFNADNDVFEKLFLCTTDPKWDAALCLAPEILDHDLWSFPTWDVPGLRSHAARLPKTGGEQDWIVDVAIPAKGVLQRFASDKFQPMTMKGDFLRYEWPSPLSGTKRSLLPLNWSPVSIGRPHISPPAYGQIILTK